MSVIKRQPKLGFHLSTALLVCGVALFPWPGFDPVGWLIFQLGGDAGFLIALTPLVILVTFLVALGFGITYLVRKQPSLQFWLEALCCVVLLLFLPAY
jgi:hypothetical protein